MSRSCFGFNSSGGRTVLMNLWAISFEREDSTKFMEDSAKILQEAARKGEA